MQRVITLRHIDTDKRHFYPKTSFANKCILCLRTFFFVSLFFIHILCNKILHHSFAWSSLLISTCFRKQAITQTIIFSLTIRELWFVFAVFLFACLYFVLPCNFIKIQRSLFMCDNNIPGEEYNHSKFFGCGFTRQMHCITSCRHTKNRIKFPYANQVWCKQNKHQQFFFLNLFSWIKNEKKRGKRYGYGHFTKQRTHPLYTLDFECKWTVYETQHFHYWHSHLIWFFFFFNFKFRLFVNET